MRYLKKKKKKLEMKRKKKKKKKNIKIKKKIKKKKKKHFVINMNLVYLADVNCFSQKGLLLVQDISKVHQQKL